MACCGRRNTSTPDRPKVLGKPNGAPAVRVKGVLTTHGIAFGEIAWVTGEDVDSLVTRGLLRRDN